MPIFPESDRQPSRRLEQHLPHLFQFNQGTEDVIFVVALWLADGGVFLAPQPCSERALSCLSGSGTVTVRMPVASQSPSTMSRYWCSPGHMCKYFCQMPPPHFSIDAKLGCQSPRIPAMATVFAVTRRKRNSTSSRRISFIDSVDHRPTNGQAVSRRPARLLLS